ncbi:unnamed protein product [Chondrus crispus]|uniref:Uncharacterized protein n=1 Tax=Chondrus crispus TaxID=2769 RepID=R7Q688_CHOCR|nr:unnamed protein product [Chondrus crispus]CDF33514.1 unnamed protein product [Chondrus crispus]|eukprot:XP_005713317.1 unnamed protein product [Chondrus crispus]
MLSSLQHVQLTLVNTGFIPPSKIPVQYKAWRRAQ